LTSSNLQCFKEVVIKYVISLKSISVSGWKFAQYWNVRWQRVTPIFLSPIRAPQLYRTECLHSLGYAVTAAVLRPALKETHCSMRSIHVKWSEDYILL
jgi:hypothetical protein